MSWYVVVCVFWITLNPLPSFLSILYPFIVEPPFNDGIAQLRTTVVEEIGVALKFVGWEGNIGDPSGEKIKFIVFPAVLLVTNAVAL